MTLPTLLSAGRITSFSSFKTVLNPSWENSESEVLSLVLDSYRKIVSSGVSLLTLSLPLPLRGDLLELLVKGQFQVWNGNCLQNQGMSSCIASLPSVPLIQVFTYSSVTCVSRLYMCFFVAKEGKGRFPEL